VALAEASLDCSPTTSLDDLVLIVSEIKLRRSKRIRCAVHMAAPGRELEIGIGANVSLGSKTVLTTAKRHFRITPRNGHRQGRPACLKCASSGLVRHADG
jgi:hypothetical protein